MNKKIQIMIMELTHDRKRFSVMCTLVAVGLLLWARLIILEDVPKTGFADPAAGPGTAQSNPNAAASDEEEMHLEELPIAYVDTESHLTRDFFKRLPIEPTQTEEAPQVPSVDSKSEPEQTEDPEAEAKCRRQEVEKAASSFRLESVMGGRHPVVVINGEVLSIGDMIDGFELEVVSDRSVTLRRDEFRVELKIK